MSHVCTHLCDFPLRTFPMNIVHKYFQETSKQLFGAFFYIFLRGSFFSREQYCCWPFQHVCGRGLLCLGLGSLFGWLLVLLLLSFRYIFGSLGKWVVLCFCCFLVWFVFLTTCKLFEQASFCGSEIYLFVCFVCVYVFLCRVCYIWGYFCFCSAFVILNVSLFLVASKWLLWLLSSVALSCQAYNLKRPWPLVLVCLWSGSVGHLCGCVLVSAGECGHHRLPFSAGLGCERDQKLLAPQGTMQQEWWQSHMDQSLPSWRWRVHPGDWSLPTSSIISLCFFSTWVPVSPLRETWSEAGDCRALWPTVKDEGGEVVFVLPDSISKGAGLR